MFKSKPWLLPAAVLAGFTMTPLFAQDTRIDAISREPVDNRGKIREVIFNTDDEQDFMTTKVYVLKYLNACDIVPYIKGAVKRYGAGNAERLAHAKGAEQYLTVTTARKLIPYIDDIIEKLDRPHNQSSYVCPYSGYDPAKEKRATIVDADGMFKEVYWPKYRHAESMLSAVVSVGTVSSDGRAFYNRDRGFFYTKDSFSDAARTMEFWGFLDRPFAQAELVFNVYEVSDQDAVELGMDWVSWKNGPANAMPLFATGLSGMDGWAGGIEQAFTAPSWMYGGLFFAPQFDVSFLRLLSNKGKIRTATAARIPITNRQSASLSFDPGFQNISKNEEMIIGVAQGVNQGYTLNITDPILCFNDPSVLNASVAENILFNYSMVTRSIAGRTNLGTESVNTVSSVGAITLMTGTEKPLGVYTTERDVEQNIGWPILSDIPYVKYVFSSTTHVKATTRYYLTVTATPILVDRNITPWAQDVMEAAKPEPPSLAPDKLAFERDAEAEAETNANALLIDEKPDFSQAEKERSEADGNSGTDAEINETPAGQEI